MDDLISRQKAINALIDALAWTWSGTWSEKAAIDAIKNLPSAEPGWIPIEEKLPEVGESVLVTFSLIEKYSWVKIARYGTPIHDEHNVCFYESDSEWGDCEISGVTAWMPLPEPYQEVNR